MDAHQVRGRPICPETVNRSCRACWRPSAPRACGSRSRPNECVACSAMRRDDRWNRARGDEPNRNPSQAEKSGGVESPVPGVAIGEDRPRKPERFPRPGSSRVGSWPVPPRVPGAADTWRRLLSRRRSRWLQPPRAARATPAVRERCATRLCRSSRRPTRATARPAPRFSPTRSMNQPTNSALNA